ncbi:hypothetical protein AAEH85_22010, partial [Shewanella algae]|uniref:hypothetical protein n=1 Tax=Shewanella algae TaxID=38313 RepID=UPI00313F1EDD
FRAVLKFPPKTVLDIDATFSHKKLNNLQDAIVNCANSPGASFSWAEYPMGGGKTIAALCLADKLMSKGAIDGLYFLLPTQATANG